MRFSKAFQVACLLAVLLPTPANAQAHNSRERDNHEWDVKAEKMRTWLLPTMREHGVDMWIIMSRENNPDPALELFGGYGISGWYGHRNAYVFYDAGDAGLETAAIGTHLSGHLSRFYDHIMSYHASDEGLAPTLREFVEARDPQVIAINQSRTISMADGISAELKDYLIDALGPDYTWHILRRAFSSEVITPGQTTLMDVYWWVKDEWMAQDLEFNFPASFDLWREGQEESLSDVEDPVIQPGDLLHVDFGVRLMGIVTDQQKMAYVLKPGEMEPPAGLQHLFEQSARQGEIIAETIKPGVLGRDIVTIAEERGQSEGIDNRTYPHVQGNWVHGVGAWGARDWPERYGIHPRQPVRPTEFWSVEYSVSGPVPEWGGQRVTMAREEDAWVDENGQVHFMVGPQKELWLVGQPTVIY